MVSLHPLDLYCFFTLSGLEAVHIVESSFEVYLCMVLIATLMLITIHTSTLTQTANSYSSLPEQLVLIQLTNQAKDLGFSNSEALVDGAAGGLVGVLTGGAGSQAVSTVLKTAVTQAANNTGCSRCCW